MIQLWYTYLHISELYHNEDGQYVTVHYEYNY